MNPVEIIAVIAIVLIIGVAIAYIVKEKKRGNKCIGCPYAKECSNRCGCQGKGKAKDKGNDSKPFNT